MSSSSRAGRGFGGNGRPGGHGLSIDIKVHTVCSFDLSNDFDKLGVILELRKRTVVL